MNNEQNIYKTLSLLTKRIMQSRQMPIYLNKFSRKDFTSYQLLTLLVHKTYENKGYRAFVDWLKASQIPQWLKLKKIPHFTTLQKFASRLNISLLEKLLLRSGTAKKACQRVALDATGMTMSNASRHYEKRINKIIKKRDFFKCAIIGDMDNQLILAVKMRKRSRHDTKDFVPLWNKIKHLPFKWFYADKGYDSNEIFDIVEKSGRKSFACIREKTKQYHRMKGKARRRALKYSIYQKKNWRALIETINSVIKRKFGSTIAAKNLHSMKVDMYLKLMTYNMYRVITRKIKMYVLFIVQFLGHIYHILLKFIEWNGENWLSVE